MASQNRQLFVAGAAACLFGVTLAAQSRDPVAFVQVSSPEQRLQYLAKARIWADPGQVTPEMILAGRPLPQPDGLQAALRGQPLGCRFAKAGKSLGGNTPKFACMTEGGRTLRIKYSDGSRDGNREIFAAVGSARLLWALGFDSDPIYPITVDCQDCPEDPMKGTGPTARRTYLATYQPAFREIVMVDGTDPNQGWRWREVDRAIDALPAGPFRDRQRMHFDALSLLAVFLQHGDRKPEQQRLACAGGLEAGAGDVQPLVGEDTQAYSVPVFFEHPGATACAEPVVAIQDVGATFGGAGRFTRGFTAKMNLASWTARPVFRSSKTADGAPVECRGALTISMAAGEGGLANPRIGEAGRRFLFERLQRLTDAHVTALLQTARVDRLAEPQTWRDPRTGSVYTGLPAWLAAFKDKVRQIGEQRCAA